jgi:hypothetical protein
MDREREPGAGGSEEMWFPAAGAGYRAVSARAPEFAIAFEAAETTERHRGAGFASVNAVPGSWLGGTGPAWQDLVVGVK